MRLAPRPPSWSLVLLVPLALSACNGEDEKAERPDPGGIFHSARLLVDRSECSDVYQLPNLID